MQASGDQLGRGAQPAPASPGLSLHLRLILLVVASTVPLLAFSLGREYLQYRAALATTGGAAQELARGTALLVEQELQTRIAALQVLALSPTLRTGGLDAFRRRAEAVVAQQFPGSAILLLREDGQQLINTRLPPGTKLPVRANMESTRQMFATGLPTVSDLFQSNPARRPVVTIDVPVMGEDGSIAYALSMNPGLDAFADVIRRHEFPAGWIVSVLDRQGVIVARLPNSEKQVGQRVSAVAFDRLSTAPGDIFASASRQDIPVVSVLSRGKSFGWTVGIAVPRSELTAPALRAATRILAADGVVLLISLALALYMARQIAVPIGALRELAVAGPGDALRPHPAIGLRETDEVVAALRQAEDNRRRSENEERCARAALRESEDRLSQAQKMAAIGELTGGLVHDFNNLLGIIIGNLDIAHSELKLEKDAEDLVGEALDAAARGAELTRRLLAFARRQPLQPERIAVNAVVAETARLLRRTLGEQIEISLNLHADLWLVVADAAQLEASLTNLATNARDAMPHGGKLSFTTRNCCLEADYATAHPDVAPGYYVMIEVTDDGTGIKPEMLSRIFEPFFTTKESGKGTGLGLTMVLGFIKQSGGHMNVRSDEGAGTTFRLYLPRADVTALAKARPLLSQIPRGSGETILVVEDNAAMRRVVLRQIETLGYRVIEAESAAAALDLLAGRRVDLLFTDVVMPGTMNGIELAHAAMARVPSLKVVATSGFPDMKLHGGGEPIGGLRLLSKPYRKDDLARALHDAFAA